MNRKRILYCEGNIDGTIGGSFYSLLFLTEGLDKSLYEPIVVFHCDNSLVPAYRAAGIDTRILTMPQPVRLARAPALPGIRGPLRIWQKAFNFWRLFAWQGVRFAWYLRRHRIDLLHLNNSIARNHPWMLGAWLARVEFITHERGINDRFSRTDRFFARRIGAIICISQAVRDNLADKGIRHPRMVVIHNGLDTGRIVARTGPETIRASHGIRESVPLVGMIGNIKEWKGQDIVVRAMARIRDQWPQVRCLLVGDIGREDGYYARKIHELISQLGLQETVVFTGYRKNVADYINAMDVVIHASVLPEPFGRVLIEAMALMKPVVAARAGAVPEIVEEGRTGLTFAPGDDADLAMKVMQLLEDRDAARKMGEHGRRRVIEEFDIHRNVQATTRLYREIGI